MPLLPVSCYALPDRTSDTWSDYMGSRRLNQPLAEQDVIWLTSRYCLKCLWLTLSHSRVINVKLPLQPHQKLYIMDNLIFIAYSDGSWLYYQYSTSLIHFPLEGWENILFIFWSERIKEICKMLRGGGFNLRDFWGIFPFDGLHLLHQDCRRRLWIRHYSSSEYEMWFCGASYYLFLNILQVCLEGEAFYHEQFVAWQGGVRRPHPLDCLVTGQLSASADRQI